MSELIIEKQSTPKISVIVPVYNVKKYIHQCIDSILGQILTDFELLLIDDGSPDNCGAICDDYAIKDSRIRVFHQENAGVSAARNKGLEVALGEWICFIDADDYIDSSYLANLYAPVNRFATLDIVSVASFLYEYSYNKNLNQTVQFNFDRDYYIESSIMHYLHAVNYGYGCCGRLYRKSLIINNRLKFIVNNNVYEDSVFMMSACLCSSAIAIVESEKYHYMHYIEHFNQTTQSSVSKKYDNFIQTSIVGIQCIEKYIKKYKYLELSFVKSSISKYYSIYLEGVLVYNQQNQRSIVFENRYILKQALYLYFKHKKYIKLGFKHQLILISVIIQNRCSYFTLLRCIVYAKESLCN